jgi:hypothetical protein
MIAERISLLHFVDSPAAALRALQARLGGEPAEATPAFAHSKTCAPQP